MQPSEKIKSFIKGWERLSLVSYKCQSGVWTIGYGHTGNDVSRGLVITKEHAEHLFAADVDDASRRLSASLGPVLTSKLGQNRFDALVSLVFNIGIGNFSGSTLLRKLRANSEDPTISAEIMRWVYSKGKRSTGLVNRRAQEVQIYKGEI